MTATPPMKNQSVGELCGPTMNGATRRARAAIQILRLPQVCARTGLCRSMIYQLEVEQRFPNRIKIGVRAVGWLEEEVQEWLTQRIEASRLTPAGSALKREPIRDISPR
jgi:prophage regulatory protein